MLPTFSRGHNQKLKVASNYIHRTAELLHDMYKLQRIINVRELLRVIFAVNFRELLRVFFAVDRQECFIKNKT